MSKLFMQKPTLASGLGNFVTTADTGVVTEAMQTIADNTTNNVSISAHGYCPKAPNSTSVFLRGDASWATPVVSASRSWDGKIVGCYGDGDPQRIYDCAILTGSVAATPTNIGTSVARISYFCLPANITVNTIRFFGVGATTNVYRCAIYNADTLARLTNELAFTTAASTWGTAGTSLNLSLTAGTRYFMAVSVNATGTTAGCLCFGTTQTSTTGQVAILPKSFPGNLGNDLNYMLGSFAQFAVTTGALPTTAATIATQGAWTGGFPCFWLDNA